jgi:hypothetical protein
MSETKVINETKAKSTRYVVEMNIPIEHVDSGEEDTMTEYLDFGSRRNYRVYEGDSFDNLSTHLDKHTPLDYYVSGEPIEAIRFVRERHLNPRIIARLITIPLAKEKNESDSESEDTDNDE